MSKINLPEQVRIAKVYLKGTGAGVVDYKAVPIEIGEDEVALLLAYKFDMTFFTEVGIHSSQALLWRKSQPKTYDALLLQDKWADDSDVVANEHYYGNVAGWTDGATILTTSRYRPLPYPVVLIRSPSLVFTNFFTDAIYATFWYMLQKVTDEQLAKLMVKDHA